MSNMDDILSGRRRDLTGMSCRAGLSVLEPLYWLGSSFKNTLFDLKIRKPYSADVPVVSVGNLTAGGTGKSPVVRWIVEHLRQSCTPVVLSRGYGAGEDGTNDEYQEMQLHFPDLIHLQNPDRVEIAKRAVADHHAEVLVLDDGFQHRRLHRDLDIVLIDATRPFGYGHTLPRGLLRESIRGLRRADFAIITRCDQVPVESLDRTLERVSNYVSQKSIAKLSFLPDRLIDIHSNAHELALIDESKYLAFCAIGNPGSFQTLLKKFRGLDSFKDFADHHRYTDKDIAGLVKLARDSSINTLVCTVKDFVKVRQLPLPEEIRIFAVVVSPEFLSGEGELRALLDGIQSQ